MARKPREAPKDTGPENASRSLPKVRAEVVIAGLAFLLSLGTALSGLALGWRGSEVTALSPTTLVFYRDGGASGVLTAALDGTVVNAASTSFGDVVTDVTLRFVGTADEAEFRFESLVTPVFSTARDDATPECPITANCVQNGQLLAIEETRHPFEVPGGASRSHFIGFVLHNRYCEGSGCGAFENAASAARILEVNETLVAEVTYSLNSDGDEPATCRVRLSGGGAGPNQTDLSDQLDRRGWATFRCERD